MKTIFYPAAQRGFQNHGWLRAAHSFSFGHYHDPGRMNFGLLRVLNDDVVAPGMGFGTHGHDNMEIVTIPLEGSLAHKDSLGSEGVIGPNEVQIMSAGSGIRHSEFNGSATEEVNLLQIWVFPKEQNISPRYDQKLFKEEDFDNNLKTVVSPAGEDGAMWINQDAYFSLGKFNEEKLLEYQINHLGNGTYIFVIEGEVKLGDQLLGKRDAAGVWDTSKLTLHIKARSKVLVIEVPMS